MAVGSVLIRHTSYQLGHDKFTSPGKDIYLFTFAKTTYAKKGVANFTIGGLDIPVGLTYTSTAWSFQTVSRIIMAVVDNGEHINIQYKGDPYCCPSWWGGFSMSGHMDPLVAFSVLSSDYQTSLGLVSYDTEIVNTGHYNMDSSIFTAPIDGVYYFSISSGLHPHLIVELVLRVNGADRYTLFHNSYIHSGIVTISGTTLVNLLSGDKVTVHLTNGQMYSSAGQHEASLVGFLYSPSFSNSSVAWMVSKTTPTTVLRHTPIAYDKVDVCFGVLFHNLSTIEITVAGVYYIYYSVRVTPLTSKIMSLTFKKNNEIMRNFTLHSFSQINDVISVGASLIFKFSAGDKLSVTPFHDVTESGDLLRSTAFMGFLIQEMTD